jgi:hypothetical protein
MTTPIFMHLFARLILALIALIVAYYVAGGIRRCFTRQSRQRDRETRYNASRYYETQCEHILRNRWMFRCEDEVGVAA